MKRKLTVALLVVVGLTAIAGTATAQDAGACEFPYETTGMYGETVVEDEPSRVVSLAPSVTQTLWEMGAQDKVVGIDSNSFYLEGTDGYTDVGTAFTGFIEETVAQEPDIVVGALLPEDATQQLEDAGLTYYSVPESGGFEGIYSNVNEVGKLVGECEAADGVVEGMRDDVQEVRSSVRGEPRPEVLYSIPQDAFSVPGNGTFIGDIIETAGGENVYADHIEGWGAISDERATQTLENDVDWIVLPGGSRGDVPRTDLYNSTTAVQEGQVLVVNENYLLQEAPRVTVPLKRMARAFHPEAFDDDGSGGGAGVDTRSDEEAGPFSASVSVDDGTARASFDEGPVETVELSVEVEGEVTVESMDASGSPGTPMMRVSVQVPEEARDSPGTIRMRIDDETLDDADVSRDDLVAVRRNGGWGTVDAEFLDTESGVTAVIDTPGFSQFAVVASTPPVALADASVEDGTVTLSAEGSYDEYGETVGYEWSVGNETHEGETVEVDTDADEATLTVTNDAGLTNETVVEIPDREDGGAQDENVTDTEGEDAEQDNEDEPDDGDDGEGLPGFTAVAAFVALAVAAFFRR
ncbi:MAG: ABC transporter substrate-binding protein [Halobacteriales archaeon]